jgi:protein-disulfide isomerase
MNDEIKPVSQSMSEEALPDPTTKPILPPPKGGFMNGGAFLTLLFLVAFFLVSFSLGLYVERTEKLKSGLEEVLANSKTVAQGGTPGQVLGLDDGKKVDEKIDIDKARTKGNENAKVTIIEYSDFECPFCKSFYDNAYKEILSKYVDTGKVKIAFKDFPLSFHKNAQFAAEASRCAAEQGKFWEMHDKLFENLENLSNDGYKKWAGEIGLNTQQFNQCMDNRKYKEAVEKETAESQRIGVQGTPTFLINGTALVGAQPFASFERAIEAELNK